MNTTATRYYAYTPTQGAKLVTHPRVSSSFAKAKGLWDGRRVGVIAITRGTAHRATTRRVYYGTLILNPTDAPDCIGVRHPDGEVSLIHTSRAVDVYDMTRTKN